MPFELQTVWSTLEVLTICYILSKLACQKACQIECSQCPLGYGHLLIGMMSKSHPEEMWNATSPQACSIAVVLNQGSVIPWAGATLAPQNWGKSWGRGRLTLPSPTACILQSALWASGQAGRWGPAVLLLRWVGPWDPPAAPGAMQARLVSWAVVVQVGDEVL